MTKEQWIKNKVERIMAEGVRRNTHAPLSKSNPRWPVSPAQAVAIANSMYSNRNKARRGKKKPRKSVKKDGYKRIIDNKARGVLGDIDFEKKIIRINKKKNRQEGKGELTKTILHEELHRIHPKMYERNIEKTMKKRIAKMSKKQKAELRKAFQK